MRHWRLSAKVVKGAIAVLPLGLLVTVGLATGIIPTTTTVTPIVSGPVTPTVATVSPTMSTVEGVAIGLPAVPTVATVSPTTSTVNGVVIGVPVEPTTATVIPTEMAVTEEFAGGVSPVTEVLISSLFEIAPTTSVATRLVNGVAPPSTGSLTASTATVTPSLASLIRLINGVAPPSVSIITPTIIFGADATPPTGSILINAGAACTKSTAVTLNLSASDPETGVTQMRFSADGTNFAAFEPFATSRSFTLPAGDGVKRVFVQFKNGAGLISASFFDDILLDTTPPTITDLQPPSGSFTNNNRPVISALVADFGSGIDPNSVVLKLDGQVVAHTFTPIETRADGTVVQGRVSFQPALPLADGPHTVQLTVSDRCGNPTAIAPPVVVDTQPPQVNITAPVVSSGSVSFSAPGASGGTVSITGPVSCAFDFTGEQVTLPQTCQLTDGTYTITVTATDAAVNTTTVTWTFTVDTTAPVISILGPEAKTYQNCGSLVISFSAADATTGVQSVSATLDGASVTDGQAIDLAALSGDTHTLRVTATDQAGNTATREVVFAIMPVCVNSFMTDSNFNPITSFDVVFTPDKATSSLKLPATNPGTYFYNAVIENKDTEAATYTLTLTLPTTITRATGATVNAFLLKGAQPVHVYADVLRTIDVTGAATVSQSPDGRTISVTSSIPAGSFVYVTVHLDFALKGDTGYSDADRTGYVEGFLLSADVASGTTTVEDLSTTFTGAGKRITGIGGFVIDSNGNPKGGLVARLFDQSEVQLGQATQILPGDGFYFLPAAGAGTYTVKIFDSSDSVKAVSQPQTLAAGEFRALDFTKMNPADPAVYGFVTDGSGQGIPGVVVEMSNVAKKVVASTSTTASGHYSFRFSAPGEYTFKVVGLQGYISDQATVRLRQFEELRLDFILRRP